jgi:16S rRNA (adenine1518-N6/adenine1519-N6)-dimethyltransferase
VLEVGAGIGTLTVAVAQRAGRVTAIEVDLRLLPPLTAAAAPYSNIQIVAGDILKKKDLAALFGGPAGSPRKVVANLPYSIAAPVLLRLLDPALRIVRLVVMVQREVAERITAAPGTDAYGRLSVAVRYWATPRIVSRVSPGAFLPAPDVESAIVEIAPSAGPRVVVPDEEEFFRIVAAGFGHRRKTLLNALAHGLGAATREIEAACASAGVDARARAETLGLGEFAALAQALHPLRRS